jgi:hypothetical protein
MVSLFMQMLDLNKKLQDAKLEHKKALLQRQIGATDAAVDKLVYELYGLTGKEIRMGEGNPNVGCKLPLYPLNVQELYSAPLSVPKSKASIVFQPAKLSPVTMPKRTCPDSSEVVRPY